MPREAVEARQKALEEKRRRIEALKAQKAERAKAATAQASAATKSFKAESLQTYVDGLLATAPPADAPPPPPATPTPRAPEDVPLRDWVRHYFGEEGLSLLARNVPLTADRLKGDDAGAAVAAKL